MPKRSMRLALFAAVLTAAEMSVGPTQLAYADYAPATGDVVGVGAGAWQYAVGFLADGDAYGDSGYNQAGNKNKLVVFSATADSNGRLSYGADGGQPGQATCGPGTGSTSGTGNASGNSPGAPCVLNPTVTLRAGSQAVPRPTDSRAAYEALVADDAAGNNSASTEVVNFASTSALQAEPSGLPQKLDAVVVGGDTLEMVAAAGVTNAVPLSAAELRSIYSANLGSCVTWNQVGGFVTDPIIPLIPPDGSGTRSVFLPQIGVSNLGSCTEVAEEDDPTAVVSVTDLRDAIEPMSQARLDLYAGVTVSGTPGGNGGYFADPSCAYLSGDPMCGTGNVANGSWVATSLKSPVAVLSGATFDGGTAFIATQPMYVYFRHGDIVSTAKFQAGTSENWLNSLFYNPCRAGQTCVSQGGVVYGTGGPPYVDQPAGQTLLQDAGITPVNTDLTSSYIPG